MALTIKTGIIHQPWWILLHGAPKLGKTTEAASTPGAVFIDLDNNGSARLDVPRADNEGKPHDWKSILRTLDELATEPHEFKTLVLDTLDGAESLCWQHVAPKGIESLGFGKGYIAAFEEFRLLLAKLELLRQKRGMNTLAISHSKVVAVPNPAGEDWQRWEPRAHKLVSGLFAQAFEAILFVHRQVTTATDDEKRKTRGFGVGDGEPVIECKESPAWMAGNRLGLPDRLPLSWAALAAAIDEGANIDKVREQVVALAPEDKREATRAWAAKQTDVAKLRAFMKAKSSKEAA